MALVDMHQEKLQHVQQEVQALGVQASTLLQMSSQLEQVELAIDHAEEAVWVVSIL